MQTLTLKPQETLVVVMDALKGIADQDGRFGKDFGLPELREIRKALINCQDFVDSLPDAAKVLFIRSEYTPDQFAPGAVPPSVTPLSDWDNANDSKWADGISPPEHAKIITKHDNDATKEEEFRTWIMSQVASGVRNVIFGGATTTSCIKQTSISLQKALAEHNVQCIIPLDLVGARTSYNIRQVIDEIRSAEVKILSSIDQIGFSS
ncbi:MAG: isochorismatase family protein [bacterium]|nr:isochorismatase family protein [bacterium]